MNTKITIAVGLAAILASLFVVPQAIFAADVSVSITPNSSTKTTDAFDPYPVEVNKGDTVTWTNGDTQIHTVQSGTPSGGATGQFGGTADAPTILLAGKTLSYTFNEEGDVPYFCSLHPSMVGLVKVSAGGGGGFTTTATIDGNSYEIKGMSETVTATAAEIEAGEAVAVTFDKAGEVELTLPKTMISGIDVVMAGDAEVQFEKVSETDTETTIKFSVPEGETEVDIMGTFVVPEFPVVLALILGASIAAIIGYTRFAKGNTTGFFRRV